MSWPSSRSGSCVSADWDLTTGQEEEEETAVATSAVPEGFAFSKQAGTKEQKVNGHVVTECVLLL